MRPLTGPSLVVALLLAPAVLSAQSIWTTTPTSRGEVGLEWTRPRGGTIPSAGMFDGIWVATGKARIGEGRYVVVAVPRISASGVSQIGNPYLGFQATESKLRTTFVLGVRLPHVDGGFTNAQLLAFRGDFDRYEEMEPNLTTIRAEGVGEMWHDSSGASVTGRAGFSILRFSNTGSADNTGFFFDYGVKFGKRFGALETGAGITGRWLFSGAAGGLAQTNFDEATVEAAWNGRVVPSVGIRFPVTDNLKRAYKTALIVGLRVPVL